MKKILSAIALLSILPTFSFAAGFQLNLQGLRQLAMGGGGAAVPWDIATIFYNPGGLSRLDNFQVYASGLAIMPSAEYTAPSGNYTVRTSARTFTPFNIYAGGPIKRGSPIGVGIGVYTPFGSGTYWPTDWAGRYMVQSINLQSIFVQPTVSYRINNYISIGAGFVYAFGSLDFKEALPLDNENGIDGEADLNGKASGYGFNAGAHIKATNNLMFGLTYRSQVNMKVKSGAADFTVPSSVESLFPNTNFHSQLPLPAVLSAAAAYRINKRFSLQFDVNYVMWHTYDSLRFDFTEHTADLQDIHAPRHYQNTAAFRLGADYNVSQKVSIMAGAAWDPSPVPDGFVSPELPDANREVLTCGFSYRPIEKLTILAACEFTTTVKRDATYNFDNFDGTYQTKAITPGIGITYDLK